MRLAISNGRPILCFVQREMIGGKALSGMAGNGTQTKRIATEKEDKTARNYEDVVKKLNTLQSNASVLAHAKNNKFNQQAKGNIHKVQTFLHRAGLKVDQLDDLSVIHVSGTKGKGSVCAMCESILRASGFKTGFFSSPHLVEVRERIRINGQPLAYDRFTDYFTTVYDRLDETKAQHGGEMPAYFRFLTVMAFHAFLQEKVDVAVIEVGVGGSYDCTNVIRKPTAVGITSLGMDHISVLGDTIEKIAWHKAAISKPGRPAFTVPQPEGGAMKVVMDTALECGASSIQCAPDIGSYDFNGVPLQLGLIGKHQFTNASLALQLCKTWIEDYQDNHKANQRNDDDSRLGEPFQLTDASNTTVTVAAEVGMPTALPFVVPRNFLKGLEACYWPGRNQTVKQDNVTYYIDGAHTPRSIMACQNWFITAAEEESWILDRPIKRILIFNSTGDRDEYSLLRPLIGCQFDGAAFCPNITGNSAKGNSAGPSNMESGVAMGINSKDADQTACFTTSDKQLARCQCNLVAFENLVEEEAQADLTLTIQDVARNPSVDWHSCLYKNSGTEIVTTETVAPRVTSVGDAKTVPSVQQCTQYHTGSPGVAPATTGVFPSIADALQWVATWADQSRTPADPVEDSGRKQKPHVQVLITGSLHLVGGVIKVLDPELVNRPGS